MIFGLRKNQFFASKNTPSLLATVIFFKEVYTQVTFQQIQNVAQKAILDFSSKSQGKLSQLEFANLAESVQLEYTEEEIQSIFKDHGDENQQFIDENGLIQVLMADLKAASTTVRGPQLGAEK